MEYEFPNSDLGIWANSRNFHKKLKSNRILFRCCLMDLMQVTHQGATFNEKLIWSAMSETYVNDTFDKKTKSSVVTLVSVYPEIPLNPLFLKGESNLSPLCKGG